MSDSLNSQKTLKILKIAVKELKSSQIEEMWTLYAQSYGNVLRHQFIDDLKEKDYVFYGTDKNGNFAGFTTAKFYIIHIEGKKTGIFYSGDTMFLPQYWGQRTLHRALAKEVLFFKLRNPGTPIYWFLVVMGYKTYLTMARNFENYWPAYDCPTPAHIQKLLHYIANERFGESYSPTLGLIKPQSGLVYLKGNVAPVTKEIADGCPEVKFLLEKNPGYAVGVEMPCLGHFDWGFVKIFTSKIIRSLISRKRAMPSRASFAK